MVLVSISGFPQCVREGMRVIAAGGSYPLAVLLAVREIQGPLGERQLGGRYCLQPSGLGKRTIGNGCHDRLMPIRGLCPEGVTRKPCRRS